MKDDDEIEIVKGVDDIGVLVCIWVFFRKDVLNVVMIL